MTASNLASGNFFLTEEKYSLLLTEVYFYMMNVITQRNDIFDMLKKQPAYQTRNRLVTPFQNGEINSERHRI